MGCRYVIDASSGVASSLFEGEVTPEEVLALQKQFHAEPAFDPDMDQLLDLRALRTETAPFGLIAELAERAPKSRTRRFAFVVATDAQRGLAREFGGLVGFSDDQYRLFEDEAEAWAWLAPDGSRRG